MRGAAHPLVSGCGYRTEEKSVEQSVEPRTEVKSGKRKTLLIAVVSVIIVVIIISAAFLLLVVLKPKLAIELWYNSDGHYGPTEADLAQVIQSSIQASGKISVTLKSDPWAVYKQNWANQRMPMFLLGWYPDYFDSDDYVSPFLSVAGAKSLGSYYNNTQVDQWVTQEQSTTDPTARAGLFQQIQTKLAADVPYVPLFAGNAQVVYDSTVTGNGDSGGEILFKEDSTAGHGSFHRPDRCPRGGAKI